MVTTQSSLSTGPPIEGPGAVDGVVTVSGVVVVLVVEVVDVDVAAVEVADVVGDVASVVMKVGAVVLAALPPPLHPAARSTKAASALVDFRILIGLLPCYADGGDAYV
jgi:hypothetical protein